MGRKPRVEYEGGIYHIIHRGNNREFIFQDKDDKEYIINHFKDLKAVMGYKVFCYVEWVDVDLVLGMLSTDRENAGKKYKDYMSEEEDVNYFSDNERGRICL